MQSTRKYPFSEMMRNFFSVVAGVLVALPITWIFGGTSPGRGVPPMLERNNPVQYAIQYEKWWKSFAWQEIFVFVTCFFMGSLIASLISTRKNILHAMLVPPIVICFCFTILGKDFLLLALPAWLFISLLAWKLSEWIKYKWKRKALT